MQASERNGALVGAIQVPAGDEMMLISDQGTLVRTVVDQVSLLSRNTQGVKLMDVRDGEKLVGMARIAEAEGSGARGRGRRRRQRRGSRGRLRRDCFYRTRRGRRSHEHEYSISPRDRPRCPRRCWRARATSCSTGTDAASR